jgi:DNA-binding SARP family transcriptional activator
MPATLPGGVHITYTQQFRRCGKPTCAPCASGARGHGPYWYAQWREAGRSRSCYLGKHPPTNLTPQTVVADTLPTATTLPGHSPCRLRVKTLGRFQVWLDGQPVPDHCWRRRKLAALFKCLIAAPKHRVPRDQVAELLWPQAEPEVSAGNLRVIVHLLRRMLDKPECESCLRYEGDVLVLNASPHGAPPHHWLDAAAFTRLAHNAIDRNDMYAGRSALALYTGDYLPDDPYQEWALQRREELRRLHVRLLLHMAALGAEQGLVDAAIAWLEKALASDPCHEQAVRQLMIMQRNAGVRAHAIRTYRGLARALRDEFDLDPESETQALYQSLLSCQSTVPEAAPYADVEPTPAMQTQGMVSPRWGST